MCSVSVLSECVCSVLNECVCVYEGSVLSECA